MNEIAIGLDLDGTLLDTEARHKAVLEKCARSMGVLLPAGFADSYYQQKREGISGVQVLRSEGIERAEELNRLWVDSIEESDFLRLDRLFPWVLPALREMNGNGFVFDLVTSRQHEDRVRKQVAEAGLERWLRSVYVSKALAGPGKSELTASLGLAAVVGDSEADWEWAKSIGAAFLPVSSGIRSERYWRGQGLEPGADIRDAFRAVSNSIHEQLSGTTKP